MINEPTTTTTTDLAPVKKTAKKKRTLATPDELLVQGAKAHYQAAAAALRKGCAHALITGLHLAALHLRTNAQGGRNDGLLSNQGFTAALEKIGIAHRTAYRWMNACHHALVRADVIGEGDDLSLCLPECGTAEWGRWETALRTTAEGMSLNRLLMGASKERTDEHRYDELISGEEEGRQRAAELLNAVAEGRYTLTQAVKALGSQEAYDALRDSGAEKVRRDPVYLDYDPIEKKAVGLVPKALGTLHNGFKHWEDYDPDAKSGLAELWLAVVKATPRELAEALRK